MIRITKAKGALYSLLIMSPYVVTYYQWMNDSPYSLKLTSLFFFGIFLHFFRKIEPGTRAELIFFGKATGTFWKDGFCLVPSLLPILHTVGIYLLWDLKKPIDTRMQNLQSRNTNINQFQDQKLPVYHVKTEVSFLGMQFSRLMGNMFGWFFSVDKRNPELIFQKIGFRIILTAIILGWASTFLPSHVAIPSAYDVVTSNVTAEEAVLPTILPTTETPEEPTTTQLPGDNSVVNVRVQLKGEPPFPLFPEKKHFKESRSDVQFFHIVNGIHYVHYQLRSDGKPPEVTVETPLCAIVPAGRIIRFSTVHPPVFVVNMKNSVEFFIDTNKLPLLKRVNMFFRPHSLEYEFRQENTWRYMVDKWNLINHAYVFVAQASEKKDILIPSLGGLVCF